jgi:predicted deacylase
MSCVTINWHTPNGIYPISAKALNMTFSTRCGGLAANTKRLNVRAENIRIPGDMSGDFTVAIFRFGAPSARPKIYMQAAMHADELLGCVALDLLIEKLLDSERNDLVVGEIILVPFANPVGLAQSIAGTTLGRFDLQSGSNFNLGWPRLLPSPIEHPAGDAPPPRPKERIRADMAEVLRTATAVTALGRLRLRLLQEAYDSDIALDLHCAPNAAAFAFMQSCHWPGQRALAAALNLRWVLYADAPSSTSFEDTLTAPWLAAGVNPDTPPGCIACTVELQNVAHSNESQAQRNATGLYLYLQLAGAVLGPERQLSEWNGRAVPYNDIVSVAADRGGLLILSVNIGDIVSEGQVVAQILEPCPAEPRNRRRAVLAPCAGTVLLTAAPGALVAAGYTACALVPTTSAPARGSTHIDVDRFG